MAGLISWLSAHPDVLGIAVFVVTSIVARYMPDTPGWLVVRSWVLDYAHRNAQAIPYNLGARLEVEDDPAAAMSGSKRTVIVLTVDGKEVKRIATLGSLR